MWLEDDAPDPRRHVVTVHGELTGRSSHALFMAVDDVLDNGAQEVIVDLTDSPFLDSTGLATLIACWRVASGRRMNGMRGMAGRDRLGLIVAAGGYTRRMLQVRGVEHLFTVTSSRDHALSTVGHAD
jgi:anti-anti-sigma factor